MTKRISVLPFVAALVIMSQPVQASQIVYEGFALTFPAFNGGTGFSGAWAQGGFNAFASGYTASDSSLFYVNGNGKAGSQGNSSLDNRGKAGLQTSGGSVSAEAFSQINGAKRSFAQPLGADNTTVYL